MGIETVDVLINEEVHKTRFENRVDKLTTACKEHGVEYTLEDKGYVDTEGDEPIKHYQLGVEIPEPHGYIFVGVLERVENRNIIYIDNEFQTEYISKGVDTPPDLRTLDLLCAYCDGTVPLVKGVLVYEPKKDDYYILSRSCYAILTYFDHPLETKFPDLVEGYYIDNEGYYIDNEGVVRVQEPSSTPKPVPFLVQASLDFFYSQESEGDEYNEGVYNWERFEGGFSRVINRGTVEKVKEHLGKQHEHVKVQEALDHMEYLQPFMIRTNQLEEENFKTYWEVGVPESRQGYFIYLTWLYYYKVLKGVEDKRKLENERRKARRDQYNTLKSKSEFEGVVGDVLETEGEIIRIGGYATQYGYTSILTIQSKEGNAIVWKTSTIPQVYEGDKVTIRGRIKQHTEYNGLNQTIITRAKLGVVKTD